MAADFRRCVNASLVVAPRLGRRGSALSQVPGAGRLAYLRAARALRTEELASRMVEVEALQIPTLIVWGAEDVFQPVAFGERLATALANRRFERVAEAGHFLPEDQPERLVELIHDFAIQA
jgi:2-hydroxymuconate-semialdehyde hydrolase